MSTALRSGLIRLAYFNPELRADLLPLIEKEAAGPSYKDYVEKKRKKNEKPLAEDAWQSRVKGKGEDEGDKGEKGGGEDEGDKKDTGVHKVYDSAPAPIKKMFEQMPATFFDKDKGYSAKPILDAVKALKKVVKPAEVPALLEKSEGMYDKAISAWGKILHKKDDPQHTATKDAYAKAMNTWRAMRVLSEDAKEKPGSFSGGKAEKPKSEKPKASFKKNYRPTMESVMTKHSLTDDDAADVIQFSIDRPKKGKEQSPAELMRRFMEHAKPETKERMKGMNPAEFMKMLRAVLDDEDGGGGGKTASLRAGLIRLAYANPDLRADLLPLIAKNAGDDEEMGDMGMDDMGMDDMDDMGMDAELEAEADPTSHGQNLPEHYYFGKTAASGEWSAVFASLDGDFKTYNAKAVTDWNKVYKDMKKKGVKDAGAAAHFYHEYRAGRMDIGEAAAALAKEGVKPPTAGGGAEKQASTGKTAEERLENIEKLLSQFASPASKNQNKPQSYYGLPPKGKQAAAPKVKGGAHPLTRDSIVYFDLVLEDYNIEEDADNGDEFAKSLMGDNQEMMKLQGKALASLKRMFGTTIMNEGHGSDGALVCKFSVDSWADVSKANDVINRHHTGGDDNMGLDVPYFEARSFRLYPDGVNNVFYSEESQAKGDWNEWLSEHKAYGKQASAPVAIENAKKGDLVTVTYKGEKVTGKVVRVKVDGAVTVDLSGKHSDEDVGYVEFKAPKGKQASVKTAAGSGAANAAFLRQSPLKNKILQAVAKHYNTSVSAMLGELTDPDAEAVYEYIGNDAGLQMQVYRDFKSKGF